MLDILVALRKLPITIELLRDTKIGNTVYEAKKKFQAGSKSFNESKDIIALWKKSCDVQASSRKPSEGAAKKIAKVTPPADDDNEDNEVEKNYDTLSQARRKVIDLKPRLHAHGLQMSATPQNVPNCARSSPSNGTTASRRSWTSSLLT